MKLRNFLIIPLIFDWIGKLRKKAPDEMMLGEAILRAKYPDLFVDIDKALSVEYDTTEIALQALDQALIKRAWSPEMRQIALVYARQKFDRIK